MPTRAAASGVSSSSEPPIWVYGRMLPTLKDWGDPSLARSSTMSPTWAPIVWAVSSLTATVLRVDLGGDVATDHAADGCLREHQQRHRDQIAVGCGVHEGATAQEALHAHRRRATRRRRCSGLLGGSERRLDDELVDLLDVEDHGDVVEPAVDAIGGRAGRGAGVDPGGERRRASDRRDEQGGHPRKMAAARARAGIWTGGGCRHDLSEATSSRPPHGVAPGRTGYRLILVSEPSSTEPLAGDEPQGGSGLAAERMRRLGRVAGLRQRGDEPYPYRFDRSHTLAEVRAEWGALEPGSETDAEVDVAGRVMLYRDTGKLVFATIRDRDGQVQLFVSKAVVGDEIFDDVKQLDLGDWVGVHGKVMTTRTGELSIKVDRVQLLSKAVRPLPDKWHGLTDTDTRFRQRYADLIVNEEARRHFEVRHATVASFRRTLHDSGFVEVETPVLHLEAGGAHAKPFTTHHNALDMDLYLRIALELHLKRLIVGGMEKVFEIGRIFRNEGISTRHNPEFTMMELYQAFADWTDVMAITERADHPGRPGRVGHDDRHDPRPAGRPRRSVAALVDVRGGVREGRRDGPSVDGDRRRSRARRPPRCHVRVVLGYRSRDRVAVRRAVRGTTSSVPRS